MTDKYDNISGDFSSWDLKTRLTNNLNSRVQFNNSPSRTFQFVKRHRFKEASFDVLTICGCNPVLDYLESPIDLLIKAGILKEVRRVYAQQI